MPASELGDTRDLQAAAAAYVTTQGPPVERPRIEGFDPLEPSAAGFPRSQVRWAFERRGQPWTATTILELRANTYYVLDLASARDKSGSFGDTFIHMIGSMRIFY